LVSWDSETLLKPSHVSYTNVGGKANMGRLFNIGWIILISSLSSCGDLDDRVHGHWAFSKRVYTSQTETKVDSIFERNILLIGKDGIYRAINGDNKVEGTWSIVSKNQINHKIDFLRVTINNEWTDFEIFKVTDNELVLQDTFSISGELIM